jgi:hypothetical protein
MRSKSFVVSAFTGPCSLWLYIDNQLILTKSEITSVDLDSGGEYIVFWYVKGPPGSTYSITISSPREAEYQLTKTLLASGKDEGSFRFAVNSISRTEETNPILV